MLAAVAAARTEAAAPPKAAAALAAFGGSKVAVAAPKAEASAAAAAPPKAAASTALAAAAAAAAQARAEEISLESPRTKEARALFEEIDEDGGGTLDREEIRTLARRLGKKINNRKLDEAMAEMDADGSGEVEFEEFLHWWKEVGSKGFFSGLSLNFLRMQPKETEAERAARIAREEAEARKERERARWMRGLDDATVAAVAAAVAPATAQPGAELPERCPICTLRGCERHVQALEDLEPEPEPQQLPPRPAEPPAEELQDSPVASTALAVVPGAALATVPAGAEEWWRHPTWYDPAVFEAVQCLEQIMWCVYQPVSAARIILSHDHSRRRREPKVDQGSTGALGEPLTQTELEKVVLKGIAITVQIGNSSGHRDVVIGQAEEDTSMGEILAALDTGLDAKPTDEMLEAFRGAGGMDAVLRHRYGLRDLHNTDGERVGGVALWSLSRTPPSLFAGWDEDESTLTVWHLVGDTTRAFFQGSHPADDRINTFALRIGT